MNIAIDARGASWYAGTGIGTYTRQIIKYLIESDELNNYHLYWWGTNYKEVEGDNVTVSIASKRHHRFFEETYIPVNLKYKGIDIYHVPQNGIGLPSKKSCKYIATIHDLIPYVMPETVGRGYLKKFISQMPQIVQSCDMIITVSEFSKQDIMRIFDVREEIIRVTPLAADDYFMPLNKETCDLYIKNKYGIDYKYILYLGGFSPRKNVKSIIVAYSRVYKNLPEDIRLVILGPSKDEHSYLIELCESLGIENKVSFIGYVPYMDLPYFYNSSELFVYPSLYEGFGLPPLEAMACGIPVITSRVSSLPEVVGDSAILVNPFDTEELKAAMEMVLGDEKLKISLRDKGIERSKLFSWKKTAENTLKVYNEAYNLLQT